ncbi:MAG: hypothetical protein DMD60_02650 [Gemmatimonadetes bacterium]|nr:MAG: hypothetical protein DMD60_02650 [Gemmatimonadota bacterium]
MQAAHRVGELPGSGFGGIGGGWRRHVWSRRNGCVVGPTRDSVGLAFCGALDWTLMGVPYVMATVSRTLCLSVEPTCCLRRSRSPSSSGPSPLRPRDGQLGISRGLFGRLGKQGSNEPQPVRGDLQFALSAGFADTCGVDISGRAYCWGMNQVGQLGDGTTKGHDQPKPVADPNWRRPSRRSRGSARFLSCKLGGVAQLVRAAES